MVCLTTTLMLYCLESDFHVHGELQKGARKAFTDLVAAESVVLAPICCTGVAWQCEHRRKSQRRGHLGRAQMSPGVPRSTGTRLH